MTDPTVGAAPTFFAGLSADELGPILERLERRQFEAGMTVLVEGERRREMYVVEGGFADVFVVDRQGREHRVGRAGPGAPLGEMSLFTGQPVSATVRAATLLDVLVLGEEDLLRTAAAYPRIYQNLGAILSERLARANRHALNTRHGRVTVLLDTAAPPLLGYALACSVAWHTRKPTLFLLISDTVPPELTALASQDVAAHGAHVGQIYRAGLTSRGTEERAQVIVAPPTGDCAPAVLAGTVDDLCHIFDYVIVQLSGEVPASLVARSIQLVGLHTPLPSKHNLQPGHTLRAWAATGSSARPDRSGVLSVPPLCPSDEQALRSGLLPASTPAGRTLAWAARRIAGLKVGLALGAGSVKGYAHLGVLRVLEHAGIPIDYLAGTSIGAVVAAMYALGYSPDDAAHLMETMGRAAFRPTLPLNALLSNAGVRANFRRVGGETRFEDLDLPLAVVAADIMTGQEVIFRRGLLRPAVLASMSIPGVYPPQRIGRYTLVDGGVVNPVPSNVAAAMGADTVIAVKLATWLVPPPADVEAVEGSGRLPSMLQVISRSIEVMQSKITTDTAAAATILIEPSFASIGSLGLRAFSQGRRFIPLGEEAAAAALPRIAAALPWLRG